MGGKILIDVVINILWKADLFKKGGGGGGSEPQTQTCGVPADRRC